MLLSTLKSGLLSQQGALLRPMVSRVSLQLLGQFHSQRRNLTSIWNGRLHLVPPRKIKPVSVLLEGLGMEIELHCLEIVELLEGPKIPI